jgi:CDP-glucose 4,6-dehydratase
MLSFEKGLNNRRIFVTGHFGFTGSWLCAWFRRIGAEVYGYSLKPDTDPTLWSLLALDEVDGIVADIMNYDQLLASMQSTRPEIVVHLAAQPLVRKSYREPLQTFAVNALGTANVLEAARHTPSVRGVVCITTDKVYENREWSWAYRENDPLGGKDPYSASKAAAEMIIKGYASSFAQEGTGLAIATARGGNIIGGGDWSEDRLIPDFARAVIQGSPLTLRFPDATRPWQHVLALVQGYGMLAAGLLSGNPRRYARAWNLGPHEQAYYSVRRVMEIMSAHWRSPELNYLDDPLPEAGALSLDSRLAHNELGWVPPWPVKEMIARTAQWYQEYEKQASRGKAGAGSMREFTLQQVDDWRASLLAMDSAV